MDRAMVPFPTSSSSRAEVRLEVPSMVLHSTRLAVIAFLDAFSNYCGSECRALTAEMDSSGLPHFGHVLLLSLGKPPRPGCHWGDRTSPDWGLRMAPFFVITGLAGIIWLVAWLFSIRWWEGGDTSSAHRGVDTQLSLRQSLPLLHDRRLTGIFLGYFVVDPIFWTEN
jgi:hypothetical protein